MKNITELAYKKAVEVIKTSSRKTGFYASGLKGGYEATWARDSVITALGASLVDKKFKIVFKKSLELLANNQTENGLIPNCVGSYNIERRSNVTFNSIDAPLWYIIGHFIYARAYDDTRLLEKYQGSIYKAFMWLQFQDPNEDGLIVQQPTMDWMDAFPHKYGRVINTQAQHYAVLKIMGQDAQAEHLKSVVNGKTEKYLSLYDKKLGYYRPWIWKDHDGDRESEEWFDSKGNLMAVMFGLADTKIRKGILKYVEKENVNDVCGCKAIWPPIKKEDKAWKSYFSKCDARKPLEYLNGGVWPFIGGFYIGALIKDRQFAKAELELEKLAEGNMQKLLTRDFKEGYEFNEWLHGKNGKPKGEPYQAWSAGMYIYAYKCVKAKKVIYFN